MGVALKERDGEVSFAVRVQPRSSRTEIAGIQGEALKIRVAAPPVDGEANDACVRFLAGALGVARSSVTIAAGQASKNKIVRVRGVTAAEARRSLGLQE